MQQLKGKCWTVLFSFVMILHLRGKEVKAAQHWVCVGFGGGEEWAYQRIGITYIPISLIHDPACWNGGVHISFYFSLSLSISLYCQKKRTWCFNIKIFSRLFWWAGMDLGWADYFLCPSALKMAADQAVALEKSSFYSAMLQWSAKKGPFAGPSPKDLLIAIFWQGLESQYTIAVAAEGLLGLECCQLYSNTLTHFYLWPYKCVSRLLIFHHVVLSTWCNFL